MSKGKPLWTLFIGKATHFRPNSRPITACGIVGAEYMGLDLAAVTCKRCLRTKAMRNYLRSIMDRMQRRDKNHV